MGRCLIVGVLDWPPGSCSGEGFVGPVEASGAGIALVGAGADWRDIGGESTRPGAAVVSADEEMDRVLPVIEGLERVLAGRATLSVDTYKAATAHAAVRIGATVVNDVSGGLLDPDLLPAVGRLGARPGGGAPRAAAAGRAGGGAPAGGRPAAGGGRRGGGAAGAGSRRRGW